MQEIESIKGKPSQYSLLTLLLLTVSGAITFFAYNKHREARRSNEEVQTLRALLDLERKHHAASQVYGAQHPLSVKLSSEIEEIEESIGGTSVAE